MQAVVSGSRWKYLVIVSCSKPDMQVMEFLTICASYPGPVQAPTRRSASLLASVKVSIASSAEAFEVHFMKRTFTLQVFKTTVMLPQDALLFSKKGKVTATPEPSKEDPSMLMSGTFAPNRQAWQSTCWVSFGIGTGCYARARRKSAKTACGC